jgi:hypothetical protein
MKSFKLLGNCQVCGRLQAVNSGMSKHGYTVAQGWFQGVCSGEGHLPMQQDNKVTQEVCADIYAEILTLETLIANLKSGKVTPKTSPESCFYKAKEVPFAEANAHMQKQTVDSHIRNTQFRINSGKAHAEYITALSARVSGQALVEEAKPVKAPMITTGEKREGDNGVYTCTQHLGARVYWNKLVGEKTYKGWTGTSAWRKLALVA